VNCINVNVNDYKFIYALSLVTELQWLRHESRLQLSLENCSVCKDDDFSADSREFQHIGPETAKAREPNVTVLVRGKFRKFLALIPV